jgi:putative transcriptional regulator
MAKQYRSKATAAAHRFAEDMHSVGMLDQKTMKHLDKMSLTPIKAFTPEDIVALREREAASQAVFARYLGLSPGLISQWERGEKHPRGASLKLLNLVEKYGLESVA